MTTILKRLATPWIIAVLAIITVASLVGAFASISISSDSSAATAAQAKKESDDNKAQTAQLLAFEKCVKDWSNATSARDRQLEHLQAIRDTANDRLQRDIALLIERDVPPSPADLRELRNASNAYLAARATYDAISKADPLPPTPQLACGGPPPHAVPHPTPTVQFTPLPSVVTRTVIPPGITLPGPTVVIPGPTVTVHCHGHCP